MRLRLSADLNESTDGADTSVQETIKAHVAISIVLTWIDQQGVKCVAQDVVTTEAYGEGWGIHNLLQAQQCIWLD